LNPCPALARGGEPDIVVTAVTVMSVGSNTTMSSKNPAAIQISLKAAARAKAVDRVVEMRGGGE
jgi:hypothetical protein